MHVASVEVNSIYRNEKGCWCIGNTDNSIYFMDEKSRTINYLNTIPWDNEDVFRRYPNCFQYDNSIICLPDRGTHILIYDIEKERYKECMVDNPNEVRIGIYNYWSDNSTLWCVSYGLNQIIEVDLNHMEVVGQYNIFDSNETLVGYGSTKDKDNIICVARNASIMSIFDTSSKQVTTYKIPLVEKGFNTILCDNERVWLTGYDEKVYIWNRQEDSIFILDQFPTKFKKKYELRDRALFFHSFITDKWIFFMAWYNYVLAVNKENFEISMLLLDDELEVPNEYYSVCYGEWDEKMEIYCSNIKNFITLDINTLYGCRSNWEISGIDKMLVRAIKQQEVIQEQKGYLRFLLKVI